MPEREGQFTRRQIQSALRRRENGTPWKKIAASMGRDEASLKQTCYQFERGEWKGKDAAWERRRNAVLRREGKGQSPSEIAKSLKMQRSAVERILMKEMVSKKLTQRDA